MHEPFLLILVDKLYLAELNLVVVRRHVNLTILDQLQCLLGAPRNFAVKKFSC